MRHVKMPITFDYYYYYYYYYCKTARININQWIIIMIDYDRAII